MGGADDITGGEVAKVPSDPVAARTAHAALARGRAALATAVDLADGKEKEEALLEALDAYREARAAEPHNVAADMGMGRALLALERWDQARLNYERARAKDEANPDAHWGVASALLLMERPGEAVPALTRVTELVPTFEFAWLQLTEVLVNAGELADAVLAFERAVGANPEAADLHLQYGDALERILNQPVPALEQYNSAIATARHPDQDNVSAGARLRAGGIHLQLEQWGEALSHFEAIIGRHV